MSRHGLPLVLSLLSTPGIAGAQALELPRVQVEADAHADFTAFKTFRWKDPQVPAGNPTVHSSIVWYVERGLQEKGLEKRSEGDCDLLVRYHASKRESLKGVPSQSSGPASGGPSTQSTRVDVHKQTLGTLTLELYRASDETLVWKATTPSVDVDRARLDDEVESAVELLLARYPPRPAVPR